MKKAPNFFKLKTFKFLIFILCLLIIILLGIADYYTGFELSFSVFYLIPVMISVWYLNLPFSISVSLISFIAWYLADIHSGLAYTNFIYPIWNAFMRLLIYLVVLIILMKLKREIDLERKLSQVDSLTSAYNRNYLYRTLKHELGRANRKNTSVTIAYIDIDNFKDINDKFGHRVGDNVLKISVHVIKNNIRSIDSISRIGGDEFIVLLVDINKGNIKKIFKRIITNLGIEMKKHNWNEITFSIGVITCKNCFLTVDDLIERADNLMYNVKNSGKNDIKYIEV